MRLQTNGGRGDGGSATEGLEAGVDDLPRFIVDLDLELHHISAGRSPDEARPHRRIALVKGSDVARIVVVIDHALVVETDSKPTKIMMIMPVLMP